MTAVAVGGQESARAAEVPAEPDEPEQSVVAPVVASVVAQRENLDATTDNATTNRPVVARDATTSRPGLVWRIEINRRRKADGGWSYHWIYRFGSGKERRSFYGGTVDRLIALNPARWNQYLEVTSGKEQERTTR